MRFLDREPVVGDRVHIEYEGEYRQVGRNTEHGVWAGTSTGTVSVYVVPDTATIRVIAPESMAGDAVTADTVLPIGSIVEGGRPGIEMLAVRILSEQHAAQIVENAVNYGDTWRIVRIGPAS